MSEREHEEQHPVQPAQEASQLADAAEATLVDESAGDEDEPGDSDSEEIGEASEASARAEEVSAVTYDAYLEETAEGAALALILDLPGCFANGATRQAALDNLQHSSAAYHAWLRQHDDYTPDVRGPFVFTVKEVFQIAHEGNYEINSFFVPDAQPATDEDIEWALTLMGWQREDLLERVSELAEEILDWMPPYASDALSIRQILDHIAQAEVWYMGRLDEKPPSIVVANLPGSTLDRLQRARQAAIMRIKSYPKEFRGKVFTHQGEQWSLRKVLRRAVWHERDHINQIDELLAAYRATRG